MPATKTKPAVEPAAAATGGELFLIDGNSLAYRAFFALPESIATADGRPTNAIYGFASMMAKILIEHRPTKFVPPAAGEGLEGTLFPGQPARKRARTSRGPAFVARSCTECPARGTTTSRPSGAFAASSRPHASGVDRSRSPDNSSTGTRGRSPDRFPVGTAGGVVAGHCSQPTARPLPAAVARSHG